MNTLPLTWKNLVFAATTVVQTILIFIFCEFAFLVSLWVSSWLQELQSIISGKDIDYSSPLLVYDAFIFAVSTYAIIFYLCARLFSSAAPCLASVLFIAWFPSFMLLAPWSNPLTWISSAGMLATLFALLVATYLGRRVRAQNSVIPSLSRNQPPEDARNSRGS